MDPKSLIDRVLEGEDPGKVILEILEPGRLWNNVSSAVKAMIQMKKDLPQDIIHKRWDEIPSDQQRDIEDFMTDTI